LYYAPAKYRFKQMHFRFNLLMPKTASRSVISLIFLLSTTAYAQQGRLPQSEFDVRAPASWVHGSIGTMVVSRAECRSFPEDQLRQRIVGIAMQEWAYFGSPEYVIREDLDDLPDEDRRRRRPQLSLEESVRVASSIAGYWASTAEGGWIVARQNDEWNGPDGEAARWRDAWSAAFISWVMCEGGIAEAEQFEHAIAHHKYIDQAIRARDGQEASALYIAYDSGEAEVLPGDLLCTGSRPRYLSLSDRRSQIGVGARTHCDIVVSLDLEAGTIDTIGGNVQSAVTLKTITIAESGALLSPVDLEGRPVFAHLKLEIGSS